MEEMVSPRDPLIDSTKNDGQAQALFVSRYGGDHISFRIYQRHPQATIRSSLMAAQKAQKLGVKIGRAWFNHIQRGGRVPESFVFAVDGALVLFRANPQAGMGFIPKTSLTPDMAQQSRIPVLTFDDVDKIANGTAREQAPRERDPSKSSKGRAEASAELWKTVTDSGELWENIDLLFEDPEYLDQVNELPQLPGIKKFLTRATSAKSSLEDLARKNRRNPRMFEAIVKQIHLFFDVLKPLTEAVRARRLGPQLFDLLR